MKCNIVLLHHEQTKGMKSFGPKALLKIKLNNKTDLIINHQIEQIANNLDKESVIVFVVGFDKDKLIKKLPMLKKHKKIIIENNEYKRYNQSYAMMLGLQAINNNLPTLVIDAGVLLNKPLPFDVDTNKETNIVFTNANTKEFDVGCTINNCDIEYMFYDLSPKWINMLCIAPKYKSTITNIASHHKNAQLFEIINYSLKDCDTKFMSINSKVYYVKNQKHKLVR